METPGALLNRLRTQRQLTQETLAVLASCSGATIYDIEKGRRPVVRPTTARSIYLALASRKPMIEADAASFFRLFHLDPTVIGDDDRPLMLDDVTRMQELARERLEYEPDRPSVAREAVRVMALRPGGHDGVPVSIPPTIIQLIANLIAAHGPTRTEEMLRSIAAMAQPPAPSPGSVPPGFVKTPPVVADGYSVSEVIPAAAPKAKRLDQGTGPASRRRARGG